MNDKNTKPGYYNYVDNSGPRVTPKIIIVACLAFLVMGLALTFVFFYRGPRQNLDDEEPAMEFIAEDSRLAGIQFLTQNGLTKEQYDDVCKKLTAYFDENYPNAKYFDYVRDSLQIIASKTIDEETKYLSPEEEAELLASIAAAGGSEDLPPDNETYEEDRDNDGIGNADMVFEMEADTGEQFEVQISSLANQRTVELKIDKK